MCVTGIGHLHCARFLADRGTISARELLSLSQMRSSRAYYNMEIQDKDSGCLDGLLVMSPQESDLTSDSRHQIYLLWIWPWNLVYGLTSLQDLSGSRGSL